MPKNKKRVLAIGLIISLMMIHLSFGIPINNIDTSTIERINDSMLLVQRQNDLPKLIDAIIWMESRYNDTIVNTKTGATGCMQIMPIFVDECNRILSIRHSNKRYTLNDRMNRQSSIEMFMLIQSHHNPKLNPLTACRLHNPTDTERYAITILERYFKSKNNHSYGK